MQRSTRRVADVRVDSWEPAQGARRATLLLLHGLWVGGWVWEAVAERLAAAGYACHAPTYRGHYDSAPVPDVGSLSFFDYVEDALTVCRALSPDVVAGHSGGGLVAQKVAESDRSLRALVLLNSAPPRGIRVAQGLGVIRAQLKYAGKIAGRRPVLPEEADYRALFLPGVPEEKAAAFCGRICPDSGRALLEILLQRVAVDARRIRAPVHVVACADDPTLGPKVQRRVARKYGASYAEYPDLGHSWFLQAGWERVVDEVGGWLARQVGAEVG